MHCRKDVLLYRTEYPYENCTALALETPFSATELLVQTRQPGSLRANWFTQRPWAHSAPVPHRGGVPAGWQRNGTVQLARGDACMRDPVS